VLVPQAEVTYGTNGRLRSATAEPGIGIHMMPRTDGIILGGTSERDVWTMDVNEPERKRVVEGHMELFASLRAPAGGPRCAWSSHESHHRSRISSICRPDNDPMCRRPRDHHVIKSPNLE
jgi:hypothetical protein